jgi:kynurenine formamidase
MRFDHLHHHLSRRQMLGGAAKLGVAGVAANLAGGAVFSTVVGAGGNEDPEGSWDGGDGHIPTGPFDDSFSVSGAMDGSWTAESTARYGADDQRGTLNEVTPEKTARTLKLLEGATAVATYSMGHAMRNGMPAFATFPPRKYQQRLVANGYIPNDPAHFTSTKTGLEGEDEWRTADRARGPLGYLASSTPAAPNMIGGHEERFPEGATYQIATQMDNLNHVGVGAYFYNGNMGPDIFTPTGTSRLGMEHVGSFVTRGVLIDVLGYMQQHNSGVVQTVNGHPMLLDSYRITVADLQDTMKWEGIKEITAGDVVVIRTGWNMLAEDDDTAEKYLATEPGIYVAEAKFLAANRPALVAADTWALEVIGDASLGPNAFPCHQYLLARWGIRIGEGVISDDLANDGKHEFVYMYSPMKAIGATAGNTPPVGLAKA